MKPARKTDRPIPNSKYFKLDKDRVPDPRLKRDDKPKDVGKK